MRRVIVTVLLLLVAVTAAATWWLNSGTTAIAAPTLDDETETRDRALADAVDATGDRAESPRATDATAHAPEARTAGSDDAARPFPEDASWLDVTVVDVDDKPLPGAEVGWFFSDDLYGDDMDWNDLEQLANRQDPLRFAGNAGWLAQADERGRVRIALVDPVIVAGRHGRLAGSFQLSKSMVTPTGGHRLVLRADDRIDVKVLTASGEPAARVPISVTAFSKSADYTLYLGPGALAVTDDEGLATVIDLEPLRTEMRDSMPPDSEVFVRPMLPGLEIPGTLISLTRPPQERVVLQLPACGSARARLDSGAIAQAEAIVLTGDDQAKWPAWMVMPIAEDGWAHFEHLPLNGTLNAYPINLWALQQKADGPKADGERVDIVIQPNSEHVMVAGRVLDHDGVLAEQYLQVRIVGDELSNSTQVRTDASGRFVASVGSMPESGNAMIGESWVQPGWRSKRDGRAMITPRNLRPGINDLGDLLLERGKLIVGGRLTQDGAPCRAKCTVNVERQMPATEKRPARWVGYGRNKEVDADGSFELWGEPCSEPLRLQVHSGELLTVQPVEFRFGATDLVVDAKSGNALAASLLLPDGVSTDQLSCNLLTKKPGEDDAVFDAYPEHHQGARYHLNWSGLEAGSYTLQLQLFGRTLREVADIVLPAEATDPRLVDIDLRSLLRGCTLRVVDAESQQGLDDFVVYVQLNGTGGMQSMYGWQAGLQVLLPHEPMEATVASSGYRPTTLRLDGETAVAQMHPWPKLLLRLADRPEYAEDWSITLTLRGPDYESLLQRMENGEDELPEHSNPSFEHFGNDGNDFHTYIGDGPHRIELWAKADDKTYRFIGVTPETVTATTETVILRVPAAQWEAARAAMDTEKPK